MWSHQNWKPIGSIARRIRCTNSSGTSTVTGTSELIKPTLQNSADPEGPGTRQTLVETLETTMRLLHPFMPFLTEEIWQTIPAQGCEHRGSALSNTRSYMGRTRNGPTLCATRTDHRPGAHIPHALELSAGETDHVLRRAQRATATGPTWTQLRSYLAHLGRGTVDLAPTTHWPTSNLLRLVTEGLSVGIAVAERRRSQQSAGSHHQAAIRADQGDRAAGGETAESGVYRQGSA